jgi:hypothetical protein
VAERLSVVPATDTKNRVHGPPALDSVRDEPLGTARASHARPPRWRASEVARLRGVGKEKHAVDVFLSERQTREYPSIEGRVGSRRAASSDTSGSSVQHPRPSTGRPVRERGRAYSEAGALGVVGCALASEPGREAVAQAFEASL